MKLREGRERNRYTKEIILRGNSTRKNVIFARVAYFIVAEFIAYYTNGTKRYAKNTDFIRRFSKLSRYDSDLFSVLLSRRFAVISNNRKFTRDSDILSSCRIKHVDTATTVEVLPQQRDYIFPRIRETDHRVTADSSGKRTIIASRIIFPRLLSVRAMSARKIFAYYRAEEQ